MQRSRIDLAVTIFSGFTQTGGDVDNVGMVRVEDEMEAYVCGLPHVRVRRYHWDADVVDIVENLWRHRPNGGTSQKQLHIVLGYSYGGQSADDMVWELNRRNDVIVTDLGMCDPVRRCRLAPGVLAATGMGEFKVPPVVETVWSFYQRNPRWSLFRKEWFQPAGHNVKVVSPQDTRWEKPIVVNETHTYIDNNAAFREKCLASLKQAIVRARTGMSVDDD